MRALRPLGALIICCVLVGGGLHSADLSAEEGSADDLAKALYAKYLAERKEKSWGAFKRRLDALRALGPLDAPRARDVLLNVVRTGRSMDDRLLAARGVARYGDLPSVKSLLGILARKGHPVLTEIAAEGLAASKRPDVLVWLADGALGLRDEVSPVLLRAHARLALPEVAAVLAARYEGWAADEGTVDLAFDAVQALGRAKRPEDKSVLLDAAGQGDARLRLAACDVLALQEESDEELASAVRTLLGDDRSLIRRAMVAGLAAAKRVMFAPELILRLDDENLRVRKAALDALRSVSKKDFGFDIGGWQRWWKERGTPAKPGRQTVPTYHGLPLYTENVVFILDRSGSMQWPHARDVVARMDVARDELVAVLGKLPEKTQFNLLAFDSKVQGWKKQAVPADAKTVAKAVRWVEKQEARKGAYTNTYGALEETFAANPDVDTIYFLSDGIPEDGEITSSEGLLAAVRGWNRYRRVAIHTIALTLESLHPGKYPITKSMRRAARFMQSLARAGDGKYQLVRLPPK